jgi:hypothetical protein
MQLHKILIGLVIVGFFAVGIASFYSVGSVTYGEGNASSLSINSSFNKMNDLNTQIEDFKDKETVQTDSSISDILGSFFTNMYQSAKVLRGSVSVMGEMTDATVEQLPAGSNSDTLKTAVSLIVIIIIFVGIFLHFVTKSERT